MVKNDAPTRCCNKLLRTEYCPHCGNKNPLITHPLHTLLEHVRAQEHKFEAYVQSGTMNRYQNAYVKWYHWRKDLEKLIKDTVAKEKNNG